MAIIGTFTRTEDGKFLGSLKTLTLSAKLLFAPETSKSKDNAPDYRVYLGTVEIGAAWKKAAKESGRVYWSVKLDDPAFAAPLFASLVERPGGDQPHSLTYFAGNASLCHALGSGQNEPSTASKPASRLVAEVKPRSREAGRRRRRA